MYCLRVEIAEPDYKRPKLNITIEYYTKKEYALDRLKELKEEYIGGNEVLDENEDYITVERLDEMISNGELNDYIYCDSYMSHPAFFSEIKVVEPKK